MIEAWWMAEARAFEATAALWALYITLGLLLAGYSASHDGQTIHYHTTHSAARMT